MSDDIYRNLSDLLSAHGAEDFHLFGRSLYKAIGCGPWTATIHEVEPQREEHHSLVIKQCPVLRESLVPRLRAFLEHDRALHPGVPEDLLRFLALDPRGRDLYTDLDEYARALDAYVARSPAPPHREYTLSFLPVFSRTDCFDPPQVTLEALRVYLWRSSPAVLHAVYYDDDRANLPPRDMEAQVGRCVGVRVGSIVEGSDVAIGPYELFFPFSTEQWDRLVQQIHREASYYWRRDNCLYGRVTLPDNDRHWFHYCWGDLDWDAEDRSHPVLPDEALGWLAEQVPHDTCNMTIPGVCCIELFDRSDEVLL